ncbi:MAG: nucleotide disphospho-sugar-binding domain-containing protein [Halobacteriota archaeon]
MKKILFIVEALTWSQVVRLVVLARGLDPRRYEIHFASARFDERLFHGTSFTRWPITPLSPEKIDAAVASGSLMRTWTKAVLTKYVAEELRLYEAIRPDLVVFDLRMSTTISAPVFGVPCANLINAYWADWSHSHGGMHEGFPVDYWLFRLPGGSIAKKYLISIGLPVLLRYFAAPVNELRREHGLPEFGDFIDVTSWGDRVLFPDDPLIAPLTHQAPHETFLGPVIWSPQIPLPAFWDELGRDRPMIYATLGSSGAVKAVPPVLEALGGMDVDVVFSTAARVTPKDIPRNVRVVEMIPGDLAARKAAVVVCSGGASTGYQALAEGTPIVAIPSNPDQFLAATAIRDAGAGVFLRAATVTPSKVRAAVERVMREERFKQTAQRVAASFAGFDPHARFRAVIDEVTAHGGAANGTIRSTAP